MKIVKTLLLFKLLFVMMFVTGTILTITKLTVTEKWIKTYTKAQSGTD